MSSKNITNGILSIVLLCLIMYYVLGDFSFQKSNLILMLIIPIFTLFTFFSVKSNKELLDNALNPVCFFIIGYIIVYFQFPLDLALGKKTVSDSIFVSPDLITPSLVLANLGLVALLIGFNRVRNVNSEHTVKAYRVINHKWLQRLFVIISLFLLLTQIQSILSGEIITQEVLENAAGGLTNRLNTLFRVVFFVHLSVAVFNAKKLQQPNLLNSFGKKSFIILIIVSLAILATGRRMALLITWAAFSWAYFYVKNKQLKLYKVLVGVAFFAVISSFIGLTRSMNTNASLQDRMIVAQESDRYSESVIPATAELAGSGYTLNHVIEHVPKKEDYFYGSFFVRNILSGIPFSHYLTRYFLDGSKKYTSSAFYITYLIQGDNYTYGNGTSVLADIYLNFGMIGVILCMYVLGVLIKQTDLRKDNMSPYSILLYAYFMGYAFVESRYGLLDPINFIMFSFLLILLCIKTSK